ncbi:MULTISPECIES: undecaprenyl-diphosphate phosphatase [Acinetobacter]|uniref:Undecaprenyl-diphosphatase 1 n=3 Tax=Acinetobacter TaxID=469 RepID=UPPP1_ACIAD|nr:MULTISPECIES: undecaprenyl-diphosphate phosphatase [Acinetobacter]Q6FEB4.1 RecName: Full=Undecaprenyl-diphosphatase 1; AltName: Full=Bacitracin resistance protein 1; AltName: Full=Undecaprenyl pyrophosphate phosphatase 1 [Acinetobacter baylyi ADP1]ENV55815.1 undecaprenyl-diphosphatase 1 [Acinetobacter baylyi DSM 14961 = CIP 107474]KAF2371555.1 undecaprenyl-diphosphatase [Acinetobacter baylyi]KAF2373419.1 undecaprenyl-diphosphatase [Acinetobacter baylyi]KAF2376735.1 undecaprenyl-diphosphatas
MDLLLLLKAAIMGIVEGITEFLPISSTGHLILASELMNFWTKEKSAVFVVAIQMGAIAAVIYEYWSRLWGAATGMVTGEEKGRHLAISLILASIPIVLVGLSFGQTVKDLLFNDVAVAIGLIVGGVIIMWIEKNPPKVNAVEVENIGLKQAIWIGLIQVLSLIPGTSRSGATIIGAMFLGVSRKAATEFSFFLGIPVIIGAGLLDLYQSHEVLQTSFDWSVLGVGILVSFVSALLLIRALVAYVAKRDFMVFAWYRIVSGLLILLFAYTGWTIW